jgi:hypothetical protein
MKQKKTRRRRSERRQRTVNVGVQLLYHGVFATFWHHNASFYNSEQMALIVSLLTSRKLISTPQTLTVNAEVACWWNGRAKRKSSSLPSMMFEDNVGEDGLSAQSSYTIDINDSNYIDYLAPHLTMFDNEVPLGENTFKKVYTQMISALNDVSVRVQKNTNTTLYAIWNGKSLNTFIRQVKASAASSKAMTSNFMNGVFITLVHISGGVMILGNVQC